MPLETLQIFPVFFIIKKIQMKFLKIAFFTNGLAEMLYWTDYGSEIAINLEEVY